MQTKKLRRIINLLSLIHQWRKKSRTPSPPRDVPAGHVAIHAGSRRFIIRATYLNHPIFRQFLIKAEEEYGFVNQGPITIPCDERIFEDSLRSLHVFPNRFSREADGLPLLVDYYAWH